jgi:ribonuclease-3
VPLPSDLEGLSEKLGHPFRDIARLEQAVTHRSFAHEHPPARDNEALEFLGDAILGFLVADLLTRAYPDEGAGGLTQQRAILVSGKTLALWAQALGLGEHLRLGRGEELTGGREKESILAAAFEAVIAALYLDGGMEAAREVVARFVARSIE